MKMEIKGEWIDELGSYLSQHDLIIAHGDSLYVLYLRWKADDPWHASFLKIREGFNIGRILEEGWPGNLAEEGWSELEVDFFKKDQLEEFKAHALQKAEEYLSKL